MPDDEMVVAYTDLLGFSKLVLNNIENAKKILSTYYNLAQKTKLEGNFDGLELFLFSDFLFIQGEEISDVVNYACTLYRECLKTNTEINQPPLMTRGGIARGSFMTQRRNEALRVRKNFVISPALVHAVHMEKLVKGQRLLISANDRDKLSHFWNPNFSAITYDKPSIRPTKDFLTYRYADLLWARDLTKGYAQSKNETSNLIDIAARLFRENYKHREVSDHYAETLRICLLSYGDLLENYQEDHNIVDNIVNTTLIEYPSDKVWLGFLEMVFTSRDAFAFETSTSIRDFLRFAIINPLWGNICSALGQQENPQLLDKIKELLRNIFVL